MSHSDFGEIISIENLHLAWKNFARGKRNRMDVLGYQTNLEENIFELHHKLKKEEYRHQNYSIFYINDPKKRRISKATVSDRIVHRVVFNYLYEKFDRTFIFDSYSCRKNKGAHLAIKRFKSFSRKASHNFACQTWALKMDVKKFFDSVDHQALSEIIKNKVTDGKILNLTSEIINSYNKYQKIGIPLGNITSQLFANIYLNELDQFAKHILKAQYCIRYTDDILVVSKNRDFLINTFENISIFAKEQLKLKIYSKEGIKTIYSGTDFLGYKIFPRYVILRSRSRKKIFLKILHSEYFPKESLISYFGALGHCNSFKIRKDICRAVVDFK